MKILPSILVAIGVLVMMWSAFGLTNNHADQERIIQRQQETIALLKDGASAAEIETSEARGAYPRRPLSLPRPRSARVLVGCFFLGVILGEAGARLRRGRTPFNA